MTDTRLVFERALADEPPLTLALEPVVAAGRRIRRRRRVAYAACATSLALVAVAAAGPLLRARPPETGIGAPEQAPLTPEQRSIANAVVAASPQGWRFDFSPARWDGMELESTVDDGSGAVRFAVRFGPDARLCNDPGADPEDCASDVEDGPTTVTWTSEGQKYRRMLAVARLHHGYGAVVETANYLLRGPLPTEPPYEEDAMYEWVRADLPYTTTQLMAVARAVQDAVTAVSGTASRTQG